MKTPKQQNFSIITCFFEGVKEVWELLNGAAQGQNIPMTAWRQNIPTGKFELNPFEYR